MAEEESQAEPDRSYLAFPLRVQNPDPPTVRKCQRIFSEFLQHPSFFTDYHRPCGEVCGSCPACIRVKQWVAKTLLDPDSLVWEVWRTESDIPVDIVGILRLSRIDPGQDGLAHYFFFDGKLSDKTDLLEWWKDWVFADHPESGWIGLDRVTVEIPSHSFALARHAVKRLGFGGPYEYRRNGSTYPVEGVKRAAKKKDGESFDLLILGLLREDT